VLIFTKGSQAEVAKRSDGLTFLQIPRLPAPILFGCPADGIEQNQEVTVTFEVTVTCFLI